MNDLFPGRPDYVGPTTGYFAFLHHEKLYEKSHDVMERVAYVKREKPDHEIPTRLHNMIYLPFMTDTLEDDFVAKRNTLYDDFAAKRKTLYDDDFVAKCKTLYDDDFVAKRNTLYDDYAAKLKPLDDDFAAKCKTLYAGILTFVLQHIPDCAWNGRELVFPEQS